MTDQEKEIVKMWLINDAIREADRARAQKEADEALVRVRDYRPPDPVPTTPNKLQVITMWDVVSWTVVVILFVAACINVVQQHCH